MLNIFFATTSKREKKEKAKMEFVGKTVKKDYKGLGVSSGTVRSYDSSAGFFEIVYDDGDTEELDFSEVDFLMKEGEAAKAEQPVHVKPRLGRKPKKRRRVEKKHETQGNPGKEETREGNERFGVDNNGNLSRNVDLNDGFAENFKESDCVDMNLNGNVDLNIGLEETLKKERGSNKDLNGNVNNLINGIDLNAGFNLNLNEGLDSGDWVNVSVDYEVFNRRDYIDLNLDVNCDVDENGGSVLSTQKRECGFDLNVEVDEEISKDDMDNFGGQVKKSNCLHMVEEETCVEEDIANGELKEVRVAEVSGLGLIEEIRKENVVSGKEFHVHDCDGVQLKEGLSEPCIKVIDGSQSDMGSSYKQGNCRGKRRKVLGNSNSATEPFLRRSTRRMPAKNHISSTTSCVVNVLSASPAVSGVREEKLLVPGCRAEHVIVAPKLQLPPSSQNLNLDGIHVLDVFSIYACLRSFSTLLFLSPFELVDFVGALNCESPSPLFDCIHVSVLHTLRKHLEHLSQEGYQSASDCLRSLNWDLLDLVTWPLFVVEYLLIHGSGLGAGFDLSHLKLFRKDYYKQPVVVKVEILRCLCDDMIEVEVIRSELNRRSFASESEMDFGRIVNIEVCKKKRAALDSSSGLCLTGEVIDDTTDWNSDECCLCKMDGSLLCCDGCPAAYHSKCVGVASHLLPEGDWYCPECAFDRHKPWMKVRKSLRGAELVGIDPHGRQYFSSCGYLLVSDTCDVKSSFKYYHMHDLNVVLDVLKSSDIFYGGIIKAICKQWDIPVGLIGASRNLDSLNSMCSDTVMKEQISAISMPLAALASSEACIAKNETVDEEKFVAGCSGHVDFKVSKSMNLLDSATAIEIPCMSSEWSAETTQTGFGIQNFPKQVPDCYNRSAKFSNHSEAPGKFPVLRDCSLTSSSLDIKRETNVKFAVPFHTSSEISTRTGNKSQVQSGTGYMNCYSVARAASLVSEEFMRKTPDKINEDSIKSDEDIISTQMKVILKKSNKFHWPNAQSLIVDAQKEKCGWCFSCKAPVDDTDCLFNMSMGHVRALPKSEIAGLQSKRNKKGHLIDVICHILSTENRLHGLLLGPWLNPHYTKFWHKSLLKASDISCLKHLLLTLEANLNRLVLSADWLKLVDSAFTMGSASHVVIASRASSKNGIGKKRGRLFDFEIAPTSNGGGGLSMCWWRGGRLSRQVFNWKVLPRSLASKAARQAGCMKIPGILYPENSDFPKRSKYVAWRAAVESSTSIDQLAFLVRELDSNIKWDDIENTHPFAALDKEARKSIRLFKKAIIRRKCLEGDGINYLLDFGKRRIIPDVVLRNGSMIKESSSERKKYWLNESYVPLHLLKSFEEKKIARKSSKLSPGKLSEAGRVVKKSSKKRGFSYLFLKAERSEYYKCGHCNKDVLIREAVCCQCCKGFFHKTHVRKSAGAIIAGCTYTCHRCQDGKFVNIDRKMGKNTAKKEKISRKSLKHPSQKLEKVATACRSVQLKTSTSLAGRRLLRSQNDKKVAAGLPLRRSARRAQYILQQDKNKKPAGCKKRKQKAKKNKAKKNTSKKSEKSISWRKKRTRAYYSYWLNGLLLSRKPDEERVIQFRRDKYFSLSEHSAVVLDPPICFLCCEAGSTSTLSYIACEICGEWFHGDAYGLNAENVSKLIGFRCHVCRKRSPPICPHMQSLTTNASRVAEAQYHVRVEHSEEVSNAVQPPSEDKKRSHSNEDTQGLSPIDECSNKDYQLCVILDTNSLMTEPELEAENRELLANEEQNSDALQISNKVLKTDILTSNENSMLVENRTNSEHDVTASLHDEAELPSSNAEMDV